MKQTESKAKEALIKYLHRRAGAGQNPVKTIVYWMLVFTSTTDYLFFRLNQRFPKYFLQQSVICHNVGQRKP